jgi:UDP-3-O-[3-hydroxymyristoyl] glucosamine N-acyltransferase
MRTAREAVAELRELVVFHAIRGRRASRVATHIASLDSAGPGAVCFSTAPTPALLEKLDAVGVAVLILSPMTPAAAWTGGMLLFITPRPRLAFAHMTGLFKRTELLGFVHPTAVIDPESFVAPTAHVGALSYVGPGCVLRAGAVLHPRVTLVRYVSVGERSVIHAGATIGADGYSYVREDDGTLVKIEHFGGVQIEADVEIGPNTNINGGTLDPTRILAGSKIDGMCHIGHNAQIGPHACVAAGTVMGRSAVKEGAWLGLNCTVLPGNDVEAGGTVAAHALVSKPVPADTTVVGVPAKAIARKRVGEVMW